MFALLVLSAVFIGIPLIMFIGWIVTILLFMFAAFWINVFHAIVALLDR